MNRLKTVLRYCLLTAIFIQFGFIRMYAVDSDRQITMMTYNIRGHYIINSRTVDKLATVIKSVTPDVVAVQEVDQRYVKDCAAQLGEKTGMKSRFLVTHKDYFGIVLLSKEEPLGVQTHLIPKGAGGGTDKADPDDNRGVIIAEFADYYFLSTHYSLNANDRDVATDYIVDFAKSVAKPVFLGGDLNIKETYRAMVTFKNNGFSILNDTKVSTYPADAPTECIDFILGYNKSSAIAYKVMDRGIANQTEIVLKDVSDHLPVYVKVELSSTTGNEQIASTEEEMEVIGSKGGYILKGFEGIARLKLYSVTGTLLSDTYVREGEVIPSINSKSDMVVLRLEKGNEVYIRKLFH